MTKQYSRRAAPALVLSSDPLGAALLGAAVDLAGFRPAYPRAEESLHETLSRVKPTHVLADGDHPTWDDAAALGPVVMRGTRLFVFGRASNVDVLNAIAAKYDATVLLLPGDIERLGQILTRRPSPSPRSRAS